MFKHAYLIITHDEFEVLRKLIGVLDDRRNDIYVHFDRKVKNVPVLHCVEANLYILDANLRIDVRWGNISQIKAEYALFEASYNPGIYSYYHLISGVHLPLKSQDYIHQFFDSCNQCEVMHLWENSDKEADFKIRRYHFFTRNFRYGNSYTRKLNQYLWLLFLFFEKKLHVFRNKKKVYYKSDNWVSLTESAIAYLLGCKDDLLKEFRFSYCGDEYFVASALCRLPDSFRIKNVPNLLAVNFYKESPLVYRNEDFEKLIKSDYLYARKFTSAQIDIVSRIVNYISEDKKLK